MGFRSLQHMKGFEVHRTRACLPRYVPPSGFGYPLDGLLPRIPRRFCFAPAALMGFTLRRFPLSANLDSVSAASDPPAVGPPVYSAAKAANRSDECRLLGSFCRECLATVQLFRLTIAGTSLGFSPSRACREGFGRDFSQPPLIRFAKPWRLLAEFAGVSEYRSAFAPPCPTTRQSAPAGQGNPSGVPAPARS